MFEQVKCPNPSCGSYRTKPSFGVLPAIGIALVLGVLALFFFSTGGNEPICGGIFLVLGLLSLFGGFTNKQYECENCKFQWERT